MFGRKEREYASCGFMDFEALADFSEELSFDELFSVNGGCGGGCCCCGGVDELIKAYNDPENVRKREESNKRWNTWWEKSNTTSFRNLAASFADLALALDKAVNDGSINKNNATVLDWNKAADSMSDYLGLKGDYTYTTDKSKTGLSDATIIQLRGSSGAGSHFVNDIGSGKYYDPWTNQTGNISDIENRIVGYRYLDYK